MDWGNYGLGEECWHVDHVRPLASFNMEDYTTPESYAAAVYALDNLAPMWGKDNRKKGAEWNGARWSKGKPISRDQLAPS